MKRSFVPYEIALKLKELGFNVDCLGYYNPNGHFLYKLYCADEYADLNIDDILKYKVHYDCVYAPMYQQVIDWLREEHKIDVVILPVFREKTGYDTFKRDGYTYEIVRVVPSTILMWSDFNQCAEDRDEENKEYPTEERCLKPSYEDYYNCLNNAIANALTIIK